MTAKCRMHNSVAAQSLAWSFSSSEWERVTTLSVDTYRSYLTSCESNSRICRRGQSPQRIDPVKGICRQVDVSDGEDQIHLSHCGARILGHQIKTSCDEQVQDRGPMAKITPRLHLSRCAQESAGSEAVGWR